MNRERWPLTPLGNAVLVVATAVAVAVAWAVVVRMLGR